jgi:hypothetical protein
MLSVWTQKVAAAGAALRSIPAGTARASLEFTYAQMLGARDQIADAARRLPMEVGDLYEEDHHRLEEALAALGRLFQRWESLTAQVSR